MFPHVNSERVIGRARHAESPELQAQGLTDPRVMQQAIGTSTKTVSTQSEYYFTKYLTYATEELRLRACAVHGMHPIC